MQNQNRHEQLSALHDNELPADELKTLMQDLKRDPLDEAERLRRYRLAGEVMRNELDAASFMDISAAVSRAIDQEPATLALKVRWRKPAWLSAAMRPVTGLAVAASVAMVTVSGVRMLAGSDTSNTPTMAPQMAATVVTPVNPQLARNVQVVSTAGQAARPQPLTEYMLRHSGYAGQATMQGVIPYARVVSVETDAR